MQALSMLDAIAIILSVTSVVITLVAFFASIKFYRDGVDLQAKASDALTKLEEKTHFIQAQVGGLFDKTLDAAIGKREALAENFEALNKQLETTKSKILQESIREIDAAGEHEVDRLTEFIDRQIELIRERIDTTRESAEQIAEDLNPTPLRSLTAILKTLSEEEQGLTSKEIAKRVAYPESWVNWRLTQLIQAGKVEGRNGKYHISSGPMTTNESD